MSKLHWEIGYPLEMLLVLSDSRQQGLFVEHQTSFIEIILCLLWYITMINESRHSQNNVNWPWPKTYKCLVLFKTHLIGLIPGLFVDYTQILRLYSYQMSFILFYDLLNFKLGNWLYKFEHCDNIFVST